MQHDVTKLSVSRYPHRPCILLFHYFWSSQKEILFAVVSSNGCIHMSLRQLEINGMAGVRLISMGFGLIGERTGCGMVGHATWSGNTRSSGRVSSSSFSSHYCSAFVSKAKGGKALFRSFQSTRVIHVQDRHCYSSNTGQSVTGLAVALEVYHHTLQWFLVSVVLLDHIRLIFISSPA